MRHKYQFLTPYMRRVLKKKLDSGEVTPSEIRRNIEVQWIVEHQDELIPQIMVNDSIIKINKETSSKIPLQPVFVKEIVKDSFMSWDTLHDYELDLAGEMKYYLDMYELKNKKK
jgi:hypothetical protein